MTLSVVAVANGAPDDPIAIGMAADIARRHTARAVVVDAFSIQPVVYAAATPNGYRQGPLMAEILGEEAVVRRQIAAQTAAEAARCGLSTSPDAAPSLSFAPLGRGLDALAPELPLADFVVIAQSMVGGMGPWIGPVGEALFEARTPVYVAREAASAAGDKAVIAWDGGFHAARAVRAALPLLREASETAILQDPDEIDTTPGSRADPARLAGWLSARGVRVAEAPLRANGRKVGQALPDRARDYGAALIVAGA
jgi:hypothetical protein